MALLGLTAFAGCGDSDSANEPRRAPAKVTLLATEPGSGRSRATLGQ